MVNNTDVLSSVNLFVSLPCSVHLARRVLQLERQNTSLSKELDRVKSQTGQISDEVNTHTHTPWGSSLMGFNQI